MKILHILERLSGAGPTRSLIALVKCQRQLGFGHKHCVVTLAKECFPPAILMAARAGMEVLRQPDAAVLRERMAAADIVQVSYWNCPSLQQFLRTEWTATRLLLWLKVLGATPPQVVTPDLLNFADFAAASSPQTLNLPGLESARSRMGCVLSSLDPERLQDCAPKPHAGFRITYIGTTNFAKLHPAFVSMSARVKIPDVCFVVCGTGGDEALRQQARESGVAERFSFRGFVDDIKPVLETTDVFGYPLSEGTSATSELALQEAMYARVPPVVFPQAGVKDLVRNGVTGLVVSSEAEYVQGLEYLFHHPADRERLGSNARAYAQTRFVPDASAQEMDAIYRRMMDLPKRERRWPDTDLALSAGGQFAALLSDAAPQFRASFAGKDLDAESRIAHSPIGLVSGEGGILHFRNAYPSDAYLRFWAGLALLGQGRFSAASREMQAATELGLSDERVGPWLATAQSETPVS